MKMIYCNQPEDSAHTYIRRWVTEAGGRISVGELHSKFQERFGFIPEFTDADGPIARQIAADSRVPVLTIEGDLVSI